MVWNGRLEKTSPVTFYQPDPNNPYEGDDQGPLAVPGQYYVELKLVAKNEIRSLCKAEPFRLRSLYENKMANNVAFNTEIAEFRRVVSGVNAYLGEMSNRLYYIQKGVQQSSDPAVLKDIAAIEENIYQVNLLLNGDGTLAGREFETLPGLAGAIEGIVGGLWSTTEQTTTTYTERLNTLKGKFTPIYKTVVNTKTMLEQLENRLEQLKLPYTPGRLPEWKG
jgi:hypothetical protein